MLHNWSTFLFRKVHWLCCGVKVTFHIEGCITCGLGSFVQSFNVLVGELVQRRGVGQTVLDEVFGGFQAHSNALQVTTDVSRPSPLDWTAETRGVRLS